MRDIVIDELIQNNIRIPETSLTAPHIISKQTLDNTSKCLQASASLCTTVDKQINIDTQYIIVDSTGTNVSLEK